MEKEHIKRQGGDNKQGVFFLRLRRGAGNRSARVLIMQFSAVVKGAKNFAGLPCKFFAAIP